MSVGQDYDEVVFCYREYNPLPDNMPWTETSVPHPYVSLNNFGSDTEAFEAFKQSEQAQKVTVIEPMTAE